MPIHNPITLTSSDTDALMERLALRPAEVARALGLSPRKVAELLSDQSDDAIPRLRLGACVLVPVEELKAWLHKRAEPKP